MTRQTYRKLILILAILAFPVAGVADSPDQSAAQLFESIMSPYCPGRTLSACPSEDARKLREELAESLAAGSTVEAETAKLVQRFGPSVLGKPSGENSIFAGVGLPLLFFLLGLAIVFLRFRRRRAASGPTAIAIPGRPSTTETDRYRNEIEQELQKRLKGE